MILRALLAALLGLIAVPVAAAPAPNPYNAKLLKLSSLQQRSVMRRAILDGDGRCGRVTATAWRGRYTNLERWDAECDRGGNYAVFIGPDASVQVRDCANLASLNLPLCRRVSPAR